MRGDKIFCFSCDGITKDLNETRGQDSRQNPRWRNTCVHCGSINTINASQFLEAKKSFVTQMIKTDTDKKRLTVYAENLKKLGIVKNYNIKKIGRKYKLYKCTKLRKKLKAALKKNEDKKKALNSMKTLLYVI